MANLDVLAKALCEQYHFERYCVYDFTLFYSIELYKYKGDDFNCSVTIMKDQFMKMSYDDLSRYVVNGIDEEVKMYEKRK